MSLCRYIKINNFCVCTKPIFSIAKPNMFVCFCMQNCRMDGDISPRQLVLVCFIWEPIAASVRFVRPRTWFKPPVENCFATDRSKAVTPMVIVFIVCGVLFEIDILALFSYILFCCVGAVFSECGDFWYAYFTSTMFLTKQMGRMLSNLRCVSTLIKDIYISLWLGWDHT